MCVGGWVGWGGGGGGGLGVNIEWGTQPYPTELKWKVGVKWCVCGGGGPSIHVIRPDRS